MVSHTKTKDSPLRLLIVNDSETEVDELLTPIREAGHDPQWKHVANAPSLREALSAQAWDAIICQYRSVALSALTAFKITREQHLDTPFFVIAENMDDGEAARATHPGAQICFARDRLERLVPAIEHEVIHARDRANHRAALEMLKESEARFRALASNLPGMVFQIQCGPNQSLRFLYVSEGCHRLFGFKQHELLRSSKRFLDAIDGPDRAALELALERSAATLSTLNWEGKMRSKGQIKWINLRSTPARLDSGRVQWQGIAADITRSKEAEAELRRSREQLSELSYHLEGAKEEERERIAGDIHDELGSTLVALKIEAALLAAKLRTVSTSGSTATAGLREKAHAIEALIDRAMSTASRVARELRPGILKEFGLLAAIECQAEDFSQHTGVACRVHCDDAGIEPNEKTSLALFRILQEALTNVAKHAHASLVVVRLRREKDNITLEIRDNGRGISEADLSKPKSFGLRGIRERISSLNGEFSVGPGEQGGSHLTLRVPDVRVSEATTPKEEDPQRNLF